MKGTTAMNGQNIPSVRVGNFIRTFPFNTATLRASHSHELDVRMVIQELHKLTAQLATSDKRPRGEDMEVKEDKNGEGDFDTLLWGPKNPPLLSQCFNPL